MSNAVSHRMLGAMIIAVLAILQGILGILRAIGWFQFGSDLMGQGLLILPLAGMFAYARGLLVAVLALLYLAFAVGVFTRRPWAWSLGIVVAILNILLVLSVMVQGELLVRAIFWAVVPAIILWYLIAPAGHEEYGTK